jgi:uncharacterized protein DUF3105
MRPRTPAPERYSELKRGADGSITRSMRRVPVPILVALAVVLPIGPVGLLVRDGEAARPAVRDPLAAVAARAGCGLTEFSEDIQSNPPVKGRFSERATVRDGSYAGERPPSLAATTHALYHGRVLIQYRPDLPAEQLTALDALVREDDSQVVLFENQTGMPAPLAATAYLSVMTCPRVDTRTLHALEAFRDRRRGFGQSF